MSGIVKVKVSQIPLGASITGFQAVGWDSTNSKVVRFDMTAFKGDKGDTGKSAFEFWQLTHPSGTMAEYEAYLKQPATDAAAAISETNEAIQEEEALRQQQEDARKSAETARNVASNMYNVTLAVPPAVGQYYAPTTARAAVPEGVRKRGLELIYETSAGVWYCERFVGASVTTWTTSTDWENVPTKKYVDDADALINTSINALKLADTKQQDSIQQIENTLNAININQEATATKEDYGILALPKNAANGGMSVKLEGLSAENLVVNGNFDSVDSWSSVFGTLGVADNVLTLTLTALPSSSSGLLQGLVTDMIVSHKYYISNEIYPKFDGATRYELGGVDSFGVNTNASTWNNRGVIITSISEAANLIFYSNINNAGYAVGDEIKFRNNRVIDLTATFGAGNEPDLATCDKMFANYFEGVKHFEAQGRIRSGNTALYLNSPALRSNGTTKDEIRKGVNGYELVQRISRVDNSILATPVVTPIAYGGILNSNSNGTVYREKVIADAGVYSDKLSIQLTDYPISSFEQIIKRSNGVETILNNATAVIAAGGLSFTHPDLVSGDLVLFTYYFANESTEGKTTLTHYDSRYVIADTANGKFYKTSIRSTNGVASIVLTEV